MTQNEMLKLAFEIGYQQALDEVGIEKVALPAALEGILRAPRELVPGMVERVRGLFRPRAQSQALAKNRALRAPIAEEAALANQAQNWRWSQSAAPRPMPVARRQAPPSYGRPGTKAELRAMPSLAPATTAGGQFVPVREPPLSPAKPKKTKTKAPAPAPEAPPPAPAPPAPAAPAGEAAAAPAMTNAEVAQQMQQARKIQDPVAYTQRMQELEKGYGKQMGEIAGQGEISPLLTWAAPMALATGGGYMLGGQEGAATGAGLALGSRLGVGPALKRIAESRGIAKTLGHAMPTLGESVKALPQGEIAKAVALGGGLGFGGGVAGHYLGKEKPKEPWYNQLMGLTPAIASAAVPYMMMKGTNPQLISQLQQLQSLQPAMPMEGQM